MEFNAPVLLLLGFAAYRITRLLVIDALFEGTRDKFHTFLGNQADKKGRLEVVWDKIYILTSCTWCTGAWVCIALYSLFVWMWPWEFGRLDWIAIAAVAGVQGILHALEPDEE